MVPAVDVEPVNAPNQMDVVATDKAATPTNVMIDPRRLGLMG
jgi:hypothetical protein